MNLPVFSQVFDQTRMAFLGVRLLNMPFWAIFNLIPAIVYKDLEASAFQVMLLVALKPITSLFSPYWSHSIYGRPDRLVSNLVWANLLKFLPFLFFPWMNNVWWFIGSFALYMLLVRGVIPAWMEIIKRNVQGRSRERLFAFGSAMDYIGMALLSLVFGQILSYYEGAWRSIFFVSALVGVFSTLLLLRLPAPNHLGPVNKEPLDLLKPWKQSLALLKKRPDFAQFQWGFMLGGSALMMIHVALPFYFVDVLKMSYSEILIAVICCKGVGFALSSFSWVKRFSELNIFAFSSYVTAATALFPLLVLMAQWHLAWLYVAYIVYGLMQAGSELSWHMSGPIFSQEEESSVYSSTNVLSVGVRGLFTPFLGSFFYSHTGATGVLLVSCAVAILATVKMRRDSKSLSPQLVSV